ncbi:MAG: DUF4232 domain-containing protein [Pseudonocardia sp.]|nr:DUF4232 domain-containing protein [Pseudonocardia sp.]
MARLTMGAVAAATLALAGCSSGGDWPTGGAVSAAPTTTTTAAPTTETPASNTASGTDDEAAGSSGTDGTGGSPDGDSGNGNAGGGIGGDGGTGGGGDGGSAGGGGDPARCTTAELKGSLGPADGAAGSVNQTLILTNVGSRTCSLRGFPGVSYVAGENGAQVGPAAAMSGPRGDDVRLGVGGSAGAAMKLVNVANYDPAACKPVPVRGLRVYPPGDTVSLFVPREGTGCSATPPGDQLSVQSLAAS